MFKKPEIVGSVFSTRKIIRTHKIKNNNFFLNCAFSKTHTDMQMKKQPNRKTPITWTYIWRIPFLVAKLLYKWLCLSVCLSGVLSDCTQLVSLPSVLVFIPPLPLHLSTPLYPQPLSLLVFTLPPFNSPFRTQTPSLLVLILPPYSTPPLGPQPLPSIPELSSYSKKWILANNCAWFEWWM